MTTSQDSVYSQDQVGIGNGISASSKTVIVGPQDWMGQGTHTKRPSSNGVMSDTVEASPGYAVAASPLVTPPRGAAEVTPDRSLSLAGNAGTSGTTTSPFFVGWQNESDGCERRSSSPTPESANSADKAGKGRSADPDERDEAVRPHVPGRADRRPVPLNIAKLTASVSPPSTSAILPPLSATAALPRAPVLSRLSTPVLTPTPASALPYFPASSSTNALQYSAAEHQPDGDNGIANETEYLQTIQPDRELNLQTPTTVSFAHMLPFPVARSESNDSISSTRNDCGGHDTTTTYSANAPVLSHRASQASVVHSSQQSEAGLLHFPSVESLRRRDSPRTSDPPLLPSLGKLSDMSRLARSEMHDDRPISPFSPSQPSYPGSTSASPSRKFSTSGSEKDLIDFASETASLDGDQQDQTMLVHAHDSMYVNDDHVAQGEYDYYDEDEEFSSGDDEEYDANPLYLALSNSTKPGGSPYLRRAWDTSKIVLVPPRYTVSREFFASDKAVHSLEEDRPEDWERYAGLHALRQGTGSPDMYTGHGRTVDGKRLHARLDSTRGEVEICIEDSDDEADTAPAHRQAVSTFDGGRPLSLTSSLARTDTTASSSSFAAIPPHLQISSSPSSSSESTNFPITPPVSPPLRPSIAIRSASGHNLVSTATPGTDMGENVAFPSMENYLKMPKRALSPSRRVKIIGEEAIYRSRKSSSSLNLLAASTSAPEPLPAPAGDTLQPSSPAGHVAVPSSAMTVTGTFPSRADQDRQRLQPPQQSPLPSPTSKTVKKRDSKVRLRIPKWLGGGSKERLSMSDNSSPVASSSTRTSLEVPSTTPSAPHQQRSTTMPAAQIHNTIIEKLRIIRIDGYVVEWPGQAEVMLPPPTLKRPSSMYRQQLSNPSSTPASTSMSASTSLDMDRRRQSTQSLNPTDSRRHSRRSMSSFSVSPGIARQSLRNHRKSSNALNYKHSNASSVSQLPLLSHDFAADIAYMLDPPEHLSHHANLFEQALREIVRLTRDFSASLTFFFGHENHLKDRLRTVILEHVWAPFEHQDLSNREKDRLYATVENVIMAFMHHQLFEQGIKPNFGVEDTHFSDVVSAYRRSNITMADFGVPALTTPSFSAAIETLAELSGMEHVREELWEKMSAPSYKKLVLLIGQTTDSASTVIALLEAKTPLDCATLVRKVIDEAIRAAEADLPQPGTSDGTARNSLATDDWIPLLAWMMIKAGSQALDSLLFYVKHFRLSDASAADIDWAIVQFEAALHYLHSDPLQLLPDSPIASPPLQSDASSPVQQRTSSQNSFERPRTTSTTSLSRDQSSADLLQTSQYAQQAEAPSNTVVGSRIVTYQPPSISRNMLGSHSRHTSIIPASMYGRSTSSSGGETASIPPVRHEGTVSNNTDERTGASRPIGSRHRHASSYSLATTELQIRPHIVQRPVSMRPPTRSFHVSQDLAAALAEPKSQATRIPLGRSQTTPNENDSSAVSNLSKQISDSGAGGGSSSHLARGSVDLQRAGSEGSHRNRSSISGDWFAWRGKGPAPTSPPLGSEGSRPESPASPVNRLMEKEESERGSFDLERSTSDISWLDWGRKRLSSMTSSTSLMESAEGRPKSIAELVAERIATSNQSTGLSATQTRPRRKSESAADMLNLDAPAQFEDAISEEALDLGNSSSTQHHHSASAGSAAEARPRHLTRAGSRPRSTLSLSSLSSVDTESSFGVPLTSGSSFVAPSPSRSALGRSHGSGSSMSLSRSRRFRREILSANLSSGLALAPQLHLDNASVSSTSGQTSPGLTSLTRLSPLLDSGSSYSGHGLHTNVHSRYIGTPFSPIQEVSNFTPSPELSTSSPGKDGRSNPSTPKSTHFPGLRPRSSTHTLCDSSVSAGNA